MPRLVGARQGGRPRGSLRQLDRRAIRRAVGSIGTSSGIQVLTAVTGILLARDLGPDHRGTLAAIVLWPSLVAAIGASGLPDSTAYHVARLTNEASRVIGAAVATAATLGVVLAIALFACSGLIFHNGSARTWGTVYVIYIPVNLVTLVLLSALTGLQRYKAFNVTRTVVFAVITLGLVVLHLLGRLTIAYAVATYLVANVVVLVAAYAAVRHALCADLSPGREHFRPLLVFGLKTHTGGVSSALNQRLDQLLISVLLAPAQLGLYAVAVTMTSANALVGSSIQAVALPSLSHTGSRGRTDATKTYLFLGIASATALTVPLYVFAPTLIGTFFGSDYIGAASAARILLIATVFLAFSRIGAACLAAAGSPLAAGAGEAIALVITLATLPPLLLRFGLVGAASASALAYATSAAWSLTRLAKVLRFSDKGVQPCPAQPASGRA